MTGFGGRVWLAGALCLTALDPSLVEASAYREKGKVAKIADTRLSVTPPRDWNRLDSKIGKHAEIWTLDGEQLDELTFFGGIEHGQPIIRERHRKREPLPKFTVATLLIDIPELLEDTYRAYKKTGAFVLTSSRPERFRGANGVRFAYDYIDDDGLSRKGDARAVIIEGKLFMVTFDAPRLYYFDRTVADYRALTDTSKLGE